jgi:arsenate reductase-like glutaredoxin family protein
LADPVTLLQAHPALMKRPVILMPDGESHIGWTPQAKAALGLDP